MRILDEKHGSDYIISVLADPLTVPQIKRLFEELLRRRNRITDKRIFIFTYWDRDIYESDKEESGGSVGYGYAHKILARAPEWKLEECWLIGVPEKSTPRGCFEAYYEASKLAWLKYTKEDWTYQEAENKVVVRDYQVPRTCIPAIVHCLTTRFLLYGRLWGKVPHLASVEVHICDRGGTALGTVEIFRAARAAALRKKTAIQWSDRHIAITNMETDAALRHKARVINEREYEFLKASHAQAKYDLYTQVWVAASRFMKIDLRRNLSNRIPPDLWW